MLLLHVCSFLYSSSMTASTGGIFFLSQMSLTFYEIRIIIKIQGLYTGHYIARQGRHTTVCRLFCCAGKENEAWVEEAQRVIFQHPGSGWL